jgi:peptide/nickel transport system permease protein
MTHDSLSSARSLAAPGVSLPTERRIEARRYRSLWADAFTRLARNRVALGAGLFFLLVVLLAVAAPLLAPYDPIKVSPSESLQPPSPRHPFGTDQLGRDILSRVLYGAQLSLRIGLISVGIASVCGIVLGLLAGFHGNWVSGLILRLMDVLLAFPGILLALGIVAILGPSLTNLMIAVGISNIPHYTRVVRANVLSIRTSVFVEAARVIGCRDGRIMFVHILPNVVASLIVLATLGVASAILTGAGLSFLGLGVQPPSPEWGAMLSSGRDHLRNSWWITTFPGLAIMLTVLAINLLGDGLRDALDPRLKNRGA